MIAPEAIVKIAMMQAVIAPKVTSGIEPSYVFSARATTSVPRKMKQPISAPTATRIKPRENAGWPGSGTYDVIITDALPVKIAALKVSVPITISANASHANRGVANRQRSSVDEQKYST